MPGARRDEGRRLQRAASSSQCLLGSNPNLSLLDSELDVLREQKDFPVTIVVVGASGDLARKKTLPALFSLYYHGMLPTRFAVVGYARSKLSREAFGEAIAQHLVCRVGERADCERQMSEFMARCHYFSGQYDAHEHWARFDQWLRDEVERGAHSRLFYLAIPPGVFSATLQGIRAEAAAQRDRGWTRVIVEKPFGRDTESYEVLREVVAACFEEDAVYRIDHYVGKPIVANISTLRLGNFVFDALWNRHCIESVQVVFKEPFGVEGRAGYFDSFGIVRDIMQNHLLQVMSLVAMEPPASPRAADINAAKVKVLREMRQLRADDFLLGQYEGYRAEPAVPPDSTTPTFAACVMEIDNERWRGVPFVLSAGKALDERRVYVKVTFRETANPGFVPEELRGKRNAIYIEIQPKPSVELSFISKIPGVSGRVAQTKLDLVYNESFEEESRDAPDAYERLIMDAIVGDRTLFISDEQIMLAWQLFDTALKQMEARPTAGQEAEPQRSSSLTGAAEAAMPYRPVIYAYGSQGPVLPETLAKKYLKGRL